MEGPHIVGKRGSRVKDTGARREVQTFLKVGRPMAVLGTWYVSAKRCSVI